MKEWIKHNLLYCIAVPVVIVAVGVAIKCGAFHTISGNPVIIADTESVPLSEENALSEDVVQDNSTGNVFSVDDNRSSSIFDKNDSQSTEKQNDKIVRKSRKAQSNKKSKAGDSLENSKKQNEKLPILKPDTPVGDIVDKFSGKKYAYISIDCTNVIPKCDEALRNVLEPTNGVLLGSTKVEIKDGDTVWDVFKRCADSKGIPYSATNSTKYSNVYISSIDNIKEFGAGGGSGWCYYVNGTAPDVGCSGYAVHDGDVINWKYDNWNIY